MGFVFTDENCSWEFDFSEAIWATDNLHEIYTDIKDSILHDVDFVIEDKDMLFIECKNANFKGMDNPKAFRPIGADSLKTVALKYYDSLHFIRGIGKDNKRLIYIYIVESRTGSITERKGIRNRLKDRLPFKLQKKYGFEKNMIDEVQVFCIDEWNRKYPQYPAVRLK